MSETIKKHASPPRFAVSPPGFETSPQVSFCPFFYVFGHLLDMFYSSKHVLWCYSTVKRCFQAHSLLLRSFWGDFWWFWAFFWHFGPKKSQKGSSWRPDACRNRTPLCMNFISGLFFDPPRLFWLLGIYFSLGSNFCNELARQPWCKPFQNDPNLVPKKCNSGEMTRKFYWPLRTHFYILIKKNSL